MKIRLGVLLIVGACAACTTNVVHSSEEQAVQEFAPPFCQKLHDCFPTDFDKAFPGGQDACVQKAESAIKDPNAASSCDGPTLDKCASDTRALACPATPADLAAPASCKGC